MSELDGAKSQKQEGAIAVRRCREVPLWQLVLIVGIHAARLVYKANLIGPIIFSSSRRNGEN
jgi:hypothetical protein